jgi:hypothetical protein
MGESLWGTILPNMPGRGASPMATAQFRQSFGKIRAQFRDPEVARQHMESHQRAGVVESMFVPMMAAMVTEPAAFA